MVDKNYRQSKPRQEELIISKTLIAFGFYSIVLFLLWLTDSSFRQNNVLYFIIILSFIYKVILLVAEWLLIWHPSVPDKPELKKKYTVDVLTTYVAGEPKEMLKKSLLAIQSLTYPHEAFLCDEADDPELKAFCHEHNIHHVTRKIKVDAKAGNINNALHTVAKGEIVLILDPDHVVESNFLDEVLPFFEDEKMGYVQVVQAYYNQYDTIIAKAAAEQTYQFYGPVMMTLNSYGAVPAIGANCTFRRSALDSIGGHAPGLTEDMHTALRLKDKGWKSVYNPVIVAKGLVPWNYSGYCLQQLKWSRGTYDLLFNVFPKVVKNLTWKERLAFLTVPLFYTSGIVAFVDFLIPIIALLSGLIPINLRVFDFLIYYTPLFFISQVIRFYHQKWYFEDHEKGTAILGGILFKATWWATMLGFIYSLIKKKVPYIPTPKDATIETPWKLLIPNFIIIAVSAFAIAYGLYRDFTPFSLFMAFLALLNILILTLGNLMAMQKQIVFLHKLFKGTFISKDSHARRFIFEKKKSIYLMFSKNSLVTLLLLLFAFANVSIFTVTPERFQRGIMNNYIGRKITGLLTEKTYIYDKDYGQIYSGVNNTKELQFYKTNAAFIKKELFLNRENDGSLSLFLDSCYANNILPFLSLSVDTASIHSASENNGLLKLSDIYGEVKSRYLPLLIMFDRNLTEVSDQDYADFYRNSFRMADSMAIRAIITWVWHSTDIDNDVKLAYYNYYEEYLIDWVYAENEEGRVEDNNYYGRIMEVIDKPLLLNETNIKNIDKSNFAKNKFEKNVVGIMGSGTKSYAKLRYNFTGLFEKRSYQEVERLKLPAYVKGIAYNPGQGSGNNEDLPPTASKLEKDFEMIQQMGCNTIRLFTSSIYDYNILKAVKKYDLDVLFGFNFMHHSYDFYLDSADNKILKNEVINIVKKYNTDTSIVAWGLGNETWENLGYAFGQPYLSMVRVSYLKYMRNLIETIKTIDTKRPVYTSETLNSSSMHEFSQYVPNLDFLGINAYYDEYLSSVQRLAQRNLNGIPYLFTEYGNIGYWDLYLNNFDANNNVYEQTSFQKAMDYQKNWNKYIFANKENNLGGVAFCWQDRYEKTATWFGVIDIFGNKKPAYYAIQDIYTDNSTDTTITAFPIPEFAIDVQYPNQTDHKIKAKAIPVKNQNISKYQYKWLVYTDISFDKIVETGFKDDLTEFTFSLPDTPAPYRIYLYVKDDAGNVITESLPIVGSW